MAMRNGRSESGMDAIAYRLAAPRVAAQALAWILLVILVYSGSVTTPAPLRAPRYASRSLTGMIGAAAAGCACAAGCAAGAAATGAVVAGAAATGGAEPNWTIGAPPCLSSTPLTTPSTESARLSRKFLPAGLWMSCQAVPSHQ